MLEESLKAIRLFQRNSIIRKSDCSFVRYTLNTINTTWSYFLSSFLSNNVYLNVSLRFPIHLNDTCLQGLSKNRSFSYLFTDLPWQLLLSHDLKALTRTVCMLCALSIRPNVQSIRYPNPFKSQHLILPLPCLCN